MRQCFKVLVVEDDADINSILCKVLSQNGYLVRGVYSGTEAKMCLEQFEYDLVLLDLMLPGVHGERLINEIRQQYHMPIIVISAKDHLESRVNVLKLGADDFVGKPFNINEVIARVEAQLRRYTHFSKQLSCTRQLTFHHLTLDTESRQVLVKGQELILTMREFSILELLMRQPNKVFTRANLFESVWNQEFIGEENTVNVHVSNLRSKLASVDPTTKYIKTVWGIGFKLQD